MLELAESSEVTADDISIIADSYCIDYGNTYSGTLFQYKQNRKLMWAMVMYMPTVRYGSYILFDRGLTSENITEFFSTIGVSPNAIYKTNLDTMGRVLSQDPLFSE